MKKYLYSVLIGILTVFVASCSEDSGDADKSYDNWQSRNDMFQSAIYSMAKDSIAAGNDNWRIYKSLQKGDTIASNVANSIVVRVLHTGNTSDADVLQTDSAMIHYCGYLMSTDYQGGTPAAPVMKGSVLTGGTLGYNFEKTWSGSYNLNTMTPSKITVYGFIDGFMTALQNMHAGDRWLVYMPNAMAYGKEVKSSIPAYSTLIFDLTLVKHSRKGTAL